MLLTVRRALAAAAVLPLVLLTPGTASADRWSAPDDPGDVQGWHFDPEPEPCGTLTDVDGSADANDDITKVVVRHTPRAVQVVVRLRDLDAELGQSVEIHLAVPDIRGWFLDVDRVRTRSGTFRVWESFIREIPEPDPEDRGECGAVAYVTSGGGCRANARVDLDASSVRASVPRRCLRYPDWVRVGVTAAGWAEDTGDGTYGGFFDEWGTPDDGASTWLPPFGPEVPVSSGGSSTRHRPGPGHRASSGRTVTDRSAMSTMSTMSAIARRELLRRWRGYPAPR